MQGLGVLSLLSVLILIITYTSGAVNETAPQKIAPINSIKSSQELTSNLNDSDYYDLLGQSWIQFNEDLNQSSYILNEYVKKNITNSEAMISTASLYILISHTIDVVENHPISKEYPDYQSNTLEGLKIFKEYLWNMAKFYETNKVYYAIEARENFNRSLLFYEKTKYLK